MKPFVGSIEASVAVPFVLEYCRQWNVPADNIERAADIWWWGVFHGGRIRAVMGLQLIADETMFVWGFYGDNSGTYAERKALARLTEIVGQLPYEMVGVILLENDRMRRHARKHGWKFDDFEPPSNGRARWRWKRPKLGEIREMVS